MMGFFRTSGCRAATGMAVVLLVILPAAPSSGSGADSSPSAERTEDREEVPDFELRNRSTFRVDHIKRNPFIPLDYTDEETPVEAPRQRFTIPQNAFRLTSIMLDPVEPLAIINGKTFGLGETIPYDAGAGIVFKLEIQRIFDGGVKLGFRGESLTVPLQRKNRD